MADETKELVYEILQIKEDLDKDIPEWSETLELMDDLKLIIDLKKLRQFEIIATNLNGLVQSIDDIHSMLYKIKEKM